MLQVVSVGEILKYHFLTLLNPSLFKLQNDNTAVRPESMPMPSPLYNDTALMKCDIGL